MEDNEGLDVVFFWYFMWEKNEAYDITTQIEKIMIVESDYMMVMYMSSLIKCEKGTE